ncbi:MAG: PQQ-binding-like beta-propeller repeat protein [Verrucomicrobiales bacterium]|nr:PQQ-binding-like beta-propeller repeat protein [Verrucomicrobiales bacterium]
MKALVAEMCRTVLGRQAARARTRQMVWRGRWKIRLRRGVGWVLSGACCLAGEGPVIGELVGQWPGYPRGGCLGVALENDRLYAAIGPGGVVVFDVENPAQIRRLGGYETGGEAWGVDVDGNRTFVAAGTAGLHILDTSDPANIRRLGAMPIALNANNVVVEGDLAYVASGSGLWVLDVNDPAMIRPLGGFGADLGSDFQHFEVVGDRVYAAFTQWGLQVLDVSAPTNLRWLGTTLDTGAESVRGVAVLGDRAYAAWFEPEWQQPWEPGERMRRLSVLDVNDPTNMVSLGMIETRGEPLNVHGKGSSVFVLERLPWPNGRLSVVDVSDPANLRELGEYVTSWDPGGLARVDDLVYVASGADGVQVLDVGDPTNIQRIGGAQTYGEAADVRVLGNRVYVADEYRGLQVLEVDPDGEVRWLGSFATSGGCRSVDVVGDLAYVADGREGVQVLEVSRPATIRRLGGLDTAGHACAIQVVENRGYVAVEEGELLVLDVSVPSDLRQLGHYVLRSAQVCGVQVVGSRAFLTLHPQGSDFAAIEVVDVTHPAAIQRLTRYSSRARRPSEYSIHVVGDLAYVGSSPIEVLDVSDPQDIRVVGRSAAGLWGGRIQVVGDLAYVVVTGYDRPGLQVLDVSDPRDLRSLGGFDTAGSARNVRIVGNLAFVADGRPGLAVIRLSGGPGCGPGLLLEPAGQTVPPVSSLPGDLKWAFTTGGAVRSSPALGVDGTVYVGSNDGKVYALDPALGEKRWDFQTGGAVDSALAVGENGTLYAGSRDGRFYALSGVDGRRLWGFGSGSNVVSSPAIGADGTVYAWAGEPGGLQGWLYALDGATGQQRWIAPTGERRVRFPVIGPDGTVHAGEQRWDGATGQRLGDTCGDGSMAVGWDGTVYFTRGLLVEDEWNIARHHFGAGACRGATGASRWQWQVARGSFLQSSAPVLGTDGTLYAFSGDSDGARPHALGAATGSLLGDWQCGVIASLAASPAAGADGTLYVGVGSSIQALAMPAMQKVWEFPTGGAVLSSPTLGTEGTVYVGSDDGRLYALQGSSGLAESPWPKFRGNAQNTGRANTPLLPPAVPRILEQPTGARVVAGGDFTLSVTVTGQPYPTCQWYHAGQSIPGATRLTFQVIGARPADAGEYQVLVSNPVGSVTSEVARVVVGYYVNVSIPRPGGTVQVKPSQSIYRPGQVVTLTAFPQPCHVFVRWDGAAQGVANPLTLTVEGHTDVNAWFGTAGGDHKWQFRTGGPVHSSPALGTNGTVYVGSSDRKLYALDGATGQKLWEYETGGGVDSSPAVGDDGTVYVGSHDAWVYAMDGATGLLRWKFLTGSNVVSSPAIGMDGVVFVGSNDRRLYALNGTTGQKVWEFLTGGAVESSPAVGPDGTVYVGSADQKLYAVNGRTGEKLWEAGIGGKVGSPALDANGRVYVGSTTTGRLYALDGPVGRRSGLFRGSSFRPSSARTAPCMEGGRRSMARPALPAGIFRSRSGSPTWPFGTL